MWVLCLHYYKYDGTITRHTFKVYKIKSKAKLQAKKIIKQFRVKAIEMINLYNEKNIVDAYYEKFETSKIEYILERDYEDEENRIEALTETCYCCFGIMPLDVNFDSDMILEYTDYR